MTDRFTNLAPPAARQGPGTMPGPMVEALDVAIERRISNAFIGDRRSVGVGIGTELAQIRPYHVGDDVRSLDPAASARTGQPHVRLQVPERALTTWLVLDISASMAFGTADRLKADVAEGTALAIGRMALRRAGQLGVVTFGAGEEQLLLPPRSSRAGNVALRRALERGVAKDGVEDPSGLADTLLRLGRIARPATLIVIVSDFRGDHAWVRRLGALRTRHAAIAIEVHDPRESDLPDVGRLAVIDPETGRRVRVNTASKSLRRRFAQIEHDRRHKLADELRRLQVPHIPLSTEGDWLAALGRGLG
ncbi:MAG: DUF58 domain-containing protein [Baekduia sp.]